jgi:hypothetical protein
VLELPVRLGGDPPQAARVTVSAPAPITAPTVVLVVAARTRRWAESRRATASLRLEPFMTPRLPPWHRQILNWGWDSAVNGDGPAESFSAGPSGVRTSTRPRASGRRGERPLRVVADDA